MPSHRRWAPTLAPRGNLAFTLIVTVLSILGAGLMLLIIGLQGWRDPGVTVLAMALAALPVGPLVGCYLWLDRYEPEPRSLLVMALLWGAFVGTAAAIVVGGVGGHFLVFTDAQSLALVAPVTEELTKGLFLFLLLSWRRHELDGILDGIVYAGMVGIGFAFVENILYLGAAWDGSDGIAPGGVEGITTTFILRCIASPFAHPLFTAFTGIGVGIAVNSRSRTVRVVAPLLGYVAAVITHALWNGSTLINDGQGFLLVYALVMVPVFVMMVGFAIWSRATERRLLTASLADAARRGLFPSADVAWVADLGGRRAAHRQAKATYGEAGAAAVRDYTRAAVEFGFLHHRYLRGTPPPDYAARGAVHLQTIALIRPHLAGSHA